MRAMGKDWKFILRRFMGGRGGASVRDVLLLCGNHQLPL